MFNKDIKLNVLESNLEHTSPEDLAATIVKILSPTPKDKIYDGAFGRMGFIHAALNFIKESNHNVNYKNLYGREINRSVYLKSLETLSDQKIGNNNFFNESSLELSAKDSNKYDIILSHPPFCIREKESEGELGIKTKEGDLKFLQHYINSLKIGGRAGIIIPNRILTSQNQDFVKVRKYLIASCNVHTILELRSGTFANTSAGASIMFFIKGGKTSHIKYFLKTKDQDSYKDFISFVNSSNESPNSFIFSIKSLDERTMILPTANKLAIDYSVEKIKGNFKDFKKYKISDKNHNLFLEINLTKSKFHHKENSVYLPTIGSKNPISDIKNINNKHQNYLQLVLNKDKIVNGYLVYFLKSDLGKMILENCYSGQYIPKISKKTLEDNLDIYLPEMDEQILISNTFQELSKLKDLMDETTLDFASDPRRAKIILEKLHYTREVFGNLSQEEKIKKIIEGGENLRVEFKETLFRNIHTGKRDKDIIVSSLKNIVGFLNADGGVLLIGVSDKGAITGIEKDIYSDNDKYILSVTQELENQLSLKTSSNIRNCISYDIFEVDKKKVLKVECKKSNEPAYLDGRFFVRLNPKCVELSAKEAHQYINDNFRKKND